MSDTAVTVRVDRRFGPAFGAVGAALGLGAAFAVGPVVGWLLDTVDGAPAPLRVLDQLPFGWALVLLTVAGGVAGWAVYAVWGEDVGEVRVDAERVVVARSTTTTTFSREEVAKIFLDKDELVMLDARSHELSRTTSDSAVAGRLGAAFERFGYPWSGIGDPHEFTPWVDRDPALDARVHDALRSRRRALADGRTGAAEEARDELRDLGVVVRDRDGRQEFRRVEE